MDEISVLAVSRKVKRGRADLSIRINSRLVDLGVCGGLPSHRNDSNKNENHNHNHNNNNININNNHHHHHHHNHHNRTRASLLFEHGSVRELKK